MNQVLSHDSNSVIMKNSPDKPPFKLCFAKDRVLGRSAVNFTNGNIITPKFYSREYGSVRDVDIGEEQLAKLEKKCPKDAHRWPLLTSHTYGWWHQRGIQPKESPFNFHKSTSDLVNFQMKIYAEDRKVKDCKH